MHFEDLEPNGALRQNSRHEISPIGDGANAAKPIEEWHASRTLRVDVDPPRESSLLDDIRARHASDGARVALTFAVSDTQSIRWTYAELLERAVAAARDLAGQGIVHGDRVLLVHPPGPAFLADFLGCVLAGVLPVPLPHPRSGRALERIAGVARDCSPRALWTDAVALGALQALISSERGLPEGLTPNATRETRVSREDVDTTIASASPSSGAAFLQYTSGSTSEPKGVVVTHTGLARQLMALAVVSRMDASAVVATWLPHYHDMGLVGGLLFPLHLGGRIVQLAPARFLQYPAAWLTLAAAERATSLVAPNFAYDLAARTVHPRLDLSSLDSVWTGAETIRPETIDRFEQAFRPRGFHPAAWIPCYGLAECTLLATGRKRREGPRVVALDSDELEQDRAVHVAPEAPTTARRRVVACGGPVLDTTIVIAEPQTRTELPEAQVGEIWVSGATLAAGYWGREEQTAASFTACTSTGGGPYFRTGDLGFLLDGELFVTGRIKEMLKVRGRNLYPQDIEAAVAAALALDGQARVAVVDVGRNGCDGVGVVIEADRMIHRLGRRAETGDADAGAELAKLTGSVRSAVVAECDVAPETIAWVDAREFLRTTSGKIRRVETGRRLRDASLPTVHREDASRASRATTAPDPSIVEGSRMRADACIHFLREFATRRLNSQLADDRRSFAPHVVLDLAERGCFGLEASRSDGGLELQHADVARVCVQLGAIDLTLAMLVGMHNALAVGTIRSAGSAELRAELLPKLTRGHGLGAFAISEPSAGSEPRRITTRAVRTQDGFQLDGEKMWIGLAPWARAIVVIAIAEDAAGAPLGTLACVVRSDNPGLVVGAELRTTGMRAIPQSRIRLVHALVPNGDVLGRPGDGFEVAQHAMQHARLHLASIALGAMQRCAQLSSRYAARRPMAGGRLADLPVTRARLAWIDGAIHAGRALVAHATRCLDAGQELPSFVNAVCKTTVPEWLGTASDWAQQILGGRGYVETNEIAQIVRDGRVLRVFEGPTESLRAHLGATLRRTPSEMSSHLRVVLRADELADRLEGTAARSHEPARDVHLGELAGVVLVAACVEAEASLTPELGRWVRDLVDRAEAAWRCPADAPAASDVADRVLSYTGDIGDLDRLAPGEEWSVDPSLIAREPDRLSSPGLSTGPAVRSSSTAASPRTDRAALLLDLRQLAEKELAKVLPAAHPGLRTDEPLSSYGLDSLGALDLATALEARLGRPVSPDLLWQCQTIEKLADALLAGSAAAQLEVGGTSATTRLSRYDAANARVASLRAGGRYPYHPVITELDGSWVVADGTRMLMLGSYEYLGLLRHRELDVAGVDGIRRFGFGHHGARMIAGTTDVHVALEARLARLMHAEDAVVFPTGFAANFGTIAALVGPGDRVIGDEWNHASIVDGCRLSGAEFEVFPHGDLDVLERLLAGGQGRHTLVVVDAVFSMDGDIADVPLISAVCRRYGALLMVDEAHAIGVLGARGHGVQEHFGLADDAIDVKMGTLSKALAGTGGFVAGSATLIEFLRHAARAYILSGALPAANAAASLAALDVLEREPERVVRLQQNAAWWKNALDEAGFDTLQSVTPIVPVVLANEQLTLEFAHRARRAGVFAVPMIYPGVPVDSPRIRTCVSASHTSEDLAHAREVFVRVGRELGVIDER
jgi:8-amino-7-oxononanoate synthase